ncbi:MAG TPA: methyltransferase domain-containing protein [Azospirillum sp.]|nr:methyltransferase domain-containing protein [Azospirillum sp.]
MAAGSSSVQDAAFRSERQLAAVAAALAGAPDADADPAQVAHVRAAILRGDDPLGDALMTLRSAEQRRPDGATYTPWEIVHAMTAWGAEHGAPERVVDVGAGSGRYLLAAADAFPDAHLIGIERDPLAARLLRANLAVRGLAERATVIVGDYRSAALPPIAGRTLFIGNPPYVRHHDLEKAWKDWYRGVLDRFGATAAAGRAVALAGLHLHFYARTAELAKPGDGGVFVTAGEWLNNTYGGALRTLLLGSLGVRRICLIDPRAPAFGETMSTAVIVGFEIGATEPLIDCRFAESLDDLRAPAAQRTVERAALAASDRWGDLVCGHAAAPDDPDLVPLRTVFRVSRGTSTGANQVWIAGDHARDLPDSVMLPTVTDAHDIIRAGGRLDDPHVLRKVIYLPPSLHRFKPAERKAIERFIAWAKRAGAAESTTARSRAHWYAIKPKEPAPILCTYMARRAPAVARNVAGVPMLNIAHGLYVRPGVSLSAEQLDAYAVWLQRNLTEHAGVSYAGAMSKFEPRDLERLAIPRPDAVVALARAGGVLRAAE